MNEINQKKFQDLIQKAKQNWSKAPNEALKLNDEASKLLDNNSDLKYYANLYNNYGCIYLNLNELKRSLEYYILSLDLYKKISKPNKVANVLNNIGAIYLYQNKYYEAINHFERSISYKRKGENNESIAKSFNNLGNVYSQIGYYEKALEYYLKSLQIREKIGDRKNVASTLMNIGIFYSITGSYDEAIQYHKKALETYKKLDVNENVKADIMQNLALDYQNIEKYEKAEKLFQEAVKLKDKSGNLLGIENIYLNRGNNYKLIKNFDKAEENLKMAHEIALRHNNKNCLIASKTSLASLYLEKKRKDGKILIDEALDMANELVSNDLLFKIYKLLYKYYNLEKNYLSALNYYQKYHKTKEDSDRDKNKKKLRRLKLQYELDKKIKENDFLKKKNKLYKSKLKTQQKLKKVKREFQNQNNKIKLISKELEQKIEKSLIGRSKSIQKVLDIAMTAASYPNVNVLITGENGTGKEIIARIIHFASKRKKYPFFPVNSSSIQNTLAESEFFGHKKGAFTGAIKDQKGYFELAHKGTLFLDEIADMNLPLQAKLLRAIEEGKIKKIGSNKEIEIDVRIISATNKDISKLLKVRKFRIDLYHRIKVVEINIPPLRERKQDIEPLLIHFVDHFTKVFNTERPSIDINVIDHLCNYSFPGNVRELKNLIERAMILSKNNDLTPADFPINESGKVNSIKNQPLSIVEKIKRALKENDFNQKKAAEQLDMSRYELIRKMKKFGIKKEDFILGTE